MMKKLLCRQLVMFLITVVYALTTLGFNLDQRIPEYFFPENEVKITDYEFNKQLENFFNRETKYGLRLREIPKMSDDQLVVVGEGNHDQVTIQYAGEKAQFVISENFKWPFTRSRDFFERFSRIELDSQNYRLVQIELDSQSYGLSSQQKFLMNFVLKSMVILFVYTEQAESFMQAGNRELLVETTEMKNGHYRVTLQYQSYREKTEEEYEKTIQEFFETVSNPKERGYALALIGRYQTDIDLAFQEQLKQSVSASFQQKGIAISPDDLVFFTDKELDLPLFEPERYMESFARSFLMLISNILSEQRAGNQLAEKKKGDLVTLIHGVFFLILIGMIIVTTGWFVTAIRIYRKDRNGEAVRIKRALALEDNYTQRQQEKENRAQQERRERILSLRAELQQLGVSEGIAVSVLRQELSEITETQIQESKKILEEEKERQQEARQNQAITARIFQAEAKIMSLRQNLTGLFFEKSKREEIEQELEKLSQELRMRNDKRRVRLDKVEKGITRLEGRIAKEVLV
jgi:hypothetical protein